MYIIGIKILIYLLRKRRALFVKYPRKFMFLKKFDSLSINSIICIEEISLFKRVDLKCKSLLHRNNYSSLPKMQNMMMIISLNICFTDLSRCCIHCTELESS